MSFIIPVVNNGAVDRQLLPPQQYVSVMDFGAKGDGVTDDTVAIHEAWSSLQPGQTLFFGMGTYVCDHLTFQDKQDVAVEASGARIVSFAELETTMLFVNCVGLQVRGLDLSSSVKESRNFSSYGLRFDDCNTVLVQGNRVHDVECAGIYFVRTHDFRVVNNTVHDNLADGIHVTGASTNGVISGNFVRDSGDDGIACVSYSHNTGLVTNISISGNTVSQTLARGIAVCGGDNITITGNAVMNTRVSGILVARGDGYDTRNTQNVVISGNVITYANYYQHTDIRGGAIQVSSSDPDMIKFVTITGNLVRHSRTYGCSLSGGISHITVTDNRFADSGASGLRLFDCSGLVRIEQNDITDTYGVGMELYRLSGFLRCSGNTVTDVHKQPPVLDADGNDTIRRYGIRIDGEGLQKGVVTDNYVLDNDARLYIGIEVKNSTDVCFDGNWSNAKTRFPDVAGASVTSSMGGVVIGSSRDATAGGGRGVVALRETSAPPTYNPEGGGALYVEEGALKYRGKSGTTTVIAEA